MKKIEKFGWTNNPIKIKINELIDAVNGLQKEDNRNTVKASLAIDRLNYREDKASQVDELQEQVKALQKPQVSEVEEGILVPDSIWFYYDREEMMTLFF